MMCSLCKRLGSTISGFQTRLAFAISQNRAVLTVNRADFIRLHKQDSDHAGIIVCTEDIDRQRLVQRIHAILATEILEKQLIRVNRPNS